MEAVYNYDDDSRCVLRWDGVLCVRRSGVDVMNNKVDVIAEKVMGCNGESDGQGQPLYRTIGGTWKVDSKDSATIDRVFDPYESGDDCFMVIDRMAELGFDSFEVERIGDHYVCYFEGVGMPKGNGETKQTAICEAALKAVT